MPVRLSRRGLVVPAAALWGLFVGLTALVAVWPGFFLDTMVDGLIARLRSSVEPALPGLRSAAGLVARLGAREVLVPLALAAGVVLSWRRRSLVPLALVVGSYLLVAGVASFTKASLARPQPLPLPGVPGRAFPSGHAAQAVVVFGALAMLAGGSRRALGLGLAAGVVAAVCVALLWRQAHWLTDMVGGVVLGAACLATVDAAMRWERSPVASHR